MKQRRLRIFLAAFIAISLLFEYSALAAGSYKGSKFSSFSKPKSFSTTKSYSGSTNRSTPGSFSKNSTKSPSSSTNKSGFTGSSKSSSQPQKAMPSGNTANNWGSKYTGSSTPSSGTRSIPKASASSNPKKLSYMEEVYKKELSKQNYNKYKQQLNTEQQKVYDETIKKTYTIPNKMNLEDAISTRTQRIRRYDSFPIFVNINTSMFPGNFGYGSAYVGPFDLWFLMRASDLFWYHHWDIIYPYRSYFDPVSFAAREAIINQMMNRNIVRDPNYMEPGWDYDLMYSPDYQERHLGDLYNTRRTIFKNPAAGFLNFIIIILTVLFIFYGLRRVSMSRNKRPPHRRGGIY